MSGAKPHNVHYVIHAFRMTEAANPPLLAPRRLKSKGISPDWNCRKELKSRALACLSRLEYTNSLFTVLVLCLLARSLPILQQVAIVKLPPAVRTLMHPPVSSIP